MSKGNLNKNTVAVTVMSNSGFLNSLKEIGVNFVQTAVGDRYVYEAMQESDYSLGGEQSGHIIIKKYATTGDGILTALMLTEEMRDTKSPISKLSKNVKLYPQHTESIKVGNKESVLSDDRVLAAVKEVEEMIGGKGRVLLRKSGTEPVIRIMVECEQESLCLSYIKKIREAIENGGYVCV